MKPTQKSLSIKWGTSQMTISNFMRDGCDFTMSDEEVARWLLTHAKRKSKLMREAIAKVLQSDDIKLTETAERRSLEDMRDYYSAQLDAATKSSVVDHERIKFWNDLLLKADESIRKSQAHEKKLGIEQGELLQRTEVERILCNVAWTGNSCIDKYSKQIAQRLSNKTPAEVHKVLKPTLVALTLFEAMKKVAKCPGEINLPQWVIDCFATEEKLYIKKK